MIINPVIYENLTSSQRVAAALDALRRGDHAEVKRLAAGVERKAYILPDAEFADRLTMQMLQDNEIRDKANAYMMLQTLMDRREDGKAPARTSIITQKILKALPQEALEAILAEENVQ